MYWLVRYKEQYDTDKGPKWRSGNYLVFALDGIEAIAIATKELQKFNNEFKINGATVSKIEAVLRPE